MRALNTTVLGVDVAATSGAAVRVRGRLVASWELDTKRPELVNLPVDRAVDLARQTGTPLVVVLEYPFGGNVRVLVGLGMARERWLASLRRARVSPKQVISVQPNTWRSAVLGREWVRAPRDDVRAHEQLTARAWTGRADLGSDESAAILISWWGCHQDPAAPRPPRRGARRAGGQRKRER